MRREKRRRRRKRSRSGEMALDPPSPSSHPQVSFLCVVAGQGKGEASH